MHGRGSTSPRQGGPKLPGPYSKKNFVIVITAKSTPLAHTNDIQRGSAELLKRALLSRR